MRLASALVAMLLVAGCATGRKDADDLPPVPIPQAEKEALNPPPSALAEVQTQLTELLERLDVLNARIAKLESGGQAPSPVPIPAAVVPVPVPRPAPEPAQPAQPAPARAPIVVHTETSSTKLADIADAYRNALMLFGKGRHAESRAAFQHVFDADPNGELADNALYWIGETYFAAGDYSNALRYYERVTKEYADQNKAPDAMLKMGLTFVKSGDLAMARRTFEEVVKKYPYSTPAASAKYELKRIKY
jgi:tol-pal system protein YbgF